MSEGGEVKGDTPLLHHKWLWSGDQGVNLLSPCVSPSAADEQSWRAVLIRVHGRWMCEIEKRAVRVEVDGVREVGWEVRREGGGC